MANPDRAVIFDMDGVIVDSEPRHERAFLEVVDAIGFGGRHGLRFADYVGRSDKELWIDFVTRNKPTERLEELLAMKRKRVVEIIRQEKPLFDGLMDLIIALSPADSREGREAGPPNALNKPPRMPHGGYRLGLASGSERAIVDEVLKLNGLAGFFSATVSGSEVERGKPAPDIFLKTASLLRVEPSACWVVEDSKPGVAAGVAAGMRVIAITNTHAAADLRAAHFVVTTYSEIMAVLAREERNKVFRPGEIQK